MHEGVAFGATSTFSQRPLRNLTGLIKMRMQLHVLQQPEQFLENNLILGKLRIAQGDLIKAIQSLERVKTSTSLELFRR